MNTDVKFLAVMRQRWLDWVFFVVILVLMCVLEYSVDPYVRFVPKNEIQELNYPMKIDTVPSWMVPVIGLVLPVVFFSIYKFGWKCEAREYHDLILGAWMNTALTGCLTSALKVSVGRNRPDYFRRCFPDGVEEFNSGGYPICHPPNDDQGFLVEGRKSFPSGHSSWSMCSMSFITFFLLGKLQVFSGTGELWKLITSFVPIFFAVAVGVTRINDYWHHWTDVVAGFLLGLAVSISIYTQYYRSPFARADTHMPLYQLITQVGRGGFRQGSIMMANRLQSLDSGLNASRPLDQKGSLEEDAEEQMLLEP